MNTIHQAPTKAFRIAAIAALIIGGFSYAIGLFNADMALNEKGYYLAVILFGLFSAVSVQKSVRDKAEGIKTSNIYCILAWVATASAISLLCIGLYNAELLLSEKGFFGMAFILSLFSAITVQKNVRDVSAIKEAETAKAENNAAFTSEKVKSDPQEKHQSLKQSTDSNATKKSVPEQSSWVKA